MRKTTHLSDEPKKRAVNQQKIPYLLRDFLLEKL